MNHGSTWGKEEIQNFPFIWSNKKKKTHQNMNCRVKSNLTGSNVYNLTKTLIIETLSFRRENTF